MPCLAEITLRSTWKPRIGADTEAIKTSRQKCQCIKCAGRRERERRAKR